MRLEPITEKLQEWHPQWYGHLVCTDQDTVANVAYTSSLEAPTRLTKTKVDRLPEGQHGVPWNKVTRCMRPSEMERTDLRFKADPAMENAKMKKKRWL